MLFCRDDTEVLREAIICVLRMPSYNKEHEHHIYYITECNRTADEIADSLISKMTSSKHICTYRTAPVVPGGVRIIVTYSEFLIAS